MVDQSKIAIGYVLAFASIYFLHVAYSIDTYYDPSLPQSTMTLNTMNTSLSVADSLDVLPSMALIIVLVIVMVLILGSVGFVGGGLS